jgi:uncharacterized protein (TIGR03437 family)
LDAFVRRYNAVGTALWTHQFAATSNVLATAVTAFGGSLYVTGNIFGTFSGQAGAGGQNEDAFVRRYDAGGTLLSTRQFGTERRDSAYSLAVNSTGVYIAGSTQRVLLSPDPDGDPDAWLVKLSGAAASPVLTSVGAVVNAASLIPESRLAPGSIASAFGVALTSESGAPPLVLLNGLSAPVFAASPSQINFQIPWELAGLAQASLTVTVNGRTSEPIVVSLASAAPGLFSTSASGAGQAAALIANTASLAAPVDLFSGSRPASRGEVVSIYATGLPAVTDSPVTGLPASASPLSHTLAQPAVRIGGVAAPVLFSGLAPGFAGLYQVDVQVPGGAPSGSAVPVELSIDGVSSNMVTIAIQ